MYATLSMLKMFDACGAGYGRVVRAIGGIDYGMDNPIPLWIGATTTAGLSDVTWILDRGTVIDADQFASVYQNAKPLLFTHIQHCARTNYAEQFMTIDETLHKGRKNSLNTLGLKILAVMDACANLRSLSEDEINTMIRFVQPAAFDNHNYRGFREVRNALLAYANLSRPHDVLKEIVEACRVSVKDDASFDRPWRELLVEKHQEFLVKQNEDEDDEDMPVRKMKKAPARGRSKARNDASDDRATKALFDACYAYRWTNGFSKTFGLDTLNSTDPNAVGRFLNVFNQRRFFESLPITGERAWNGHTLPNDMNHHNPVDVLVQRDEDGYLVRSVFAISDPTIARQVARFVRAAELNVKKNILTVGTEDEDGNVTLEKRERIAAGLNPQGNNDDEDEDEDDEDEDVGEEADEDDDEDEDDDREVSYAKKGKATPTVSTASINLSVNDLFRSEQELTTIYLTTPASSATTPPTPVVSVTTTETEPTYAKRRARSRVVS